MWRAAQNASRMLLAGMAFTMMFFLTPRSGWISGAQAPSASAPEQVPIDQLEDPGSCLWCDDVQTTESCADGDAMWRSDGTSDDECSDEPTGAGPNA